jgi:surfeit locus 1 family protein
VSLRFGSRIFAPSLWLTLVTLVVLALLICLGRWQLRRAAEKQALYDAFAAGGGSTMTVDGATAPVTRYQHLEARGHYDPGRQVLIDNMVSADGRAGYYVITPFALDGGGWLLVNRGWVPLGDSRQHKPAVEVDGNERAVHGRADHLPVPGIRMGTAAKLSAPYPAVADFPSLGDLSALLQINSWSPATEVLLLDKGEEGGYLRAWSAPGIPPMRHLAYAVQWFGLALTLVVIYIVTNLRRVTHD